MKPAPGAQVVFLLAQVEKTSGDELGGLILEDAAGPALKDLGLRTAMGVRITDRETQQSAGMREGTRAFLEKRPAAFRGK